MRNLIFVATLALLAACGPDAELVASGKIHSCTMASLQQQLQANPEDQGLQTQLREASELLQAVIESADEGDRADLQAAIHEAVAAGCN